MPSRPARAGLGPTRAAPRTRFGPGSSSCGRTCCAGAWTPAPPRSPGICSTSSSPSRATIHRILQAAQLVAPQLVVILPGAGNEAPSSSDATDMGQHVLDALKGLVTGPWLAGIGRPYSGAYEICRSYEEAREAFELGQRLGLSEGIARASDILVHRVVIRDTDAILDLVDSVLSPLSAARGGAQPLVATLVPTSPGRRGHRGRQAPQHLRPVRHIPPCQGDGPHRPRPSPSRPPVRVADRGPGRTAAEMARHAIAERAPGPPCR